MSELTPDHLEEELADLLDNVVPTRGYEMTPLVGIGGSAGAIPALQRFFTSVPPEPGIAFVVVLHLAPERDSIVAEILQRCTSMPVVQVQHTTRVESNTVYVIPPGKAIKSANGHLRLSDLESPTGRRVAVDLFFRALADTHGPHSGAVVLSGGDGDGAIGIKRVKERGGLTIAQDPAQAEHPSMPAAAIATGMVDWILPVEEIAPRLRDYYGIEKQLQLPPEEGLQPARPSDEPADAPLHEVLAFLRARTGRDFTYYKRATIVRRIARRMQVNGVDALPAYLDCLRTRAGEAAALLQDLLISVTNFFRDAECFAALATQLDSLLAGKGSNDVLRVWVPACATGEEAYSVAMLLAERARLMDAPPTLQIFATDLDEAAVQAGRDGIYPAAIEADVSPERLRRFFIKEPKGYRVRPELREMVLFATHDLLRDSPFSRLDLITCRNLLIYLDPTAQRRVFDILGFAMRRDGKLFLGASETVEEGDPEFVVVDKKHRIFARRANSRPGVPVPNGPSSLALAMRLGQPASPAPVVAAHLLQRPGGPRPELRFGSARAASWGEMHLKLLEHLGPPSVLVDGRDDVVHVSAHAGRFLQYSAGEPSRNLLRLVLPVLRIELRAALYRATQSGAEVSTGPVRLPGDGGAQQVAVRVVPVRDADLDVKLVLFEASDPVPESPPAPAAEGEGEADPLVKQLDHELERMRLHLRDTVDQYEASTHELKASNEELQAINEELRSATEELETSREELQSINEELTTVNQELKTKVDELAHSNADMQNLMDATAIATVFLDRSLAITRYTPSATRLFNLIPGDIGRPLTDLAPLLQYPQLGEDASRVLERLAPIEREVGRDDGSWFLVRLLPYRTAEDRIAGVVLSFINITERKQAEEISQWLSAVVASSMDAIISFSLDGRVLSWNGGAQRIFGYVADEVIGQPIAQLARPGSEADEARLLEAVAAGRHIEDFEATQRAKDGSEVHVSLAVAPIVDAKGRVVGGTATARDVGEARQAQQALRSSEERLRLIVENARDYAIFSTDDQRIITSWNAGAQRLLGYVEAEAVGRSADMIFTPEDRAAGAPEQEARTARQNEQAADERFHLRKDGSRFWGSGTFMRMKDDAGNPIGFVKILRDQTEAREAQAALERSQAELTESLQQNERARSELEAADAAKDRFIAVLSHELRNPLASITSAAVLLTQAGTPDTERARAAQIVRRQARSMKVLVDDLLDVSRLAVSALELRRTIVTVASVVEAAVETAQPPMEAAGHQLRIRMPEEPLCIDVDPLRICQAIVNLLTNAARYTQPGGDITLTVDLEGDEVRIAVADNGVGMSRETMASMFELYSQGPAPSHRHKEGLGLGLALVRSIVALHGGRVEASSEGLGQGSRFCVWLPVAATSHADASPPPLPTAAQHRLRILIADDNVDAAWSLGKLLQTEGHEAVTAAGGAEALELCERERPDVAILDIGMPGMSGVEVAQRLRAQSWADEMILIALTGWGQSEGADAMRRHFDALLTKPVDMSELNRQLAALLARRGDGGAAAP